MTAGERQNPLDSDLLEDCVDAYTNDKEWYPIVAKARRLCTAGHDEQTLTALVAAAIWEGVAAERGACAEIARSFGVEWGEEIGKPRVGAEMIEGAIRARNESP